MRRSRSISQVIAVGFLGTMLGVGIGFILFCPKIHERRSSPKSAPTFSVRVCSLEELDYGDYHEPPRGTVVVVLDDGRDTPPGWVECNGQSLTEEQYPELFTDVGLEGQEQLILPSLPRVHIMCASPSAPKSETMPFLMLIQTRADPFLMWQKLRLLIRVD